MNYQIMKDVANAKRYYYYSCDECADETLELYVQTLDDRYSVVNSKTRYFFDLENLRKLKKAMLEFGEEKLEVALVRAFYIFTHVEDWFDEESFENFCSKNCIYHRKTKVASGSNRSVLDRAQMARQQKRHPHGVLLLLVEQA